MTDDAQAGREDLLEAARNDPAFLQAARKQGESAWTALQSAMDAKPAFVEDALSLIDSLLFECEDVQAEFLAQQDKGPYTVSVIGFDRLCVVRAPEYPSAGPFTSHDEAIRYIQFNFGEFLQEEAVIPWRRRSQGTSNPPEVALASAAPSVNTAPAKTIVRYRITKLNDDRYIRHRARLADTDHTHTRAQLLEFLLGLGRHSTETQQEIVRDLRGAGWDDLGQDCERAWAEAARRQAERQTAAERALRASALAFMRERLRTSVDPTPSQVEAAAKEWAWKDFAPADPNDEEAAYGYARWARQRYYLALNVYTESKRA